MHDDSRRVTGEAGDTLLEAMRRIFRNAEAPCGGAGRCGRCRVMVREEPPSGRSVLSAVSDEEMRLLGPGLVEAGGRLSCLARFARSGDVFVSWTERAFFIPDGETGAPSPAAPRGGVCLAVDIGTTTVAAALAEISGGRIVARGAAANRQRSYGPDVVSRIGKAVRSPGDLAAMQRLIRAQVGELAADLFSQAGGAVPERIHICGNTTMLHLWEGADLAGLSRMPFQPVFLAGRESILELTDGRRLPCRLLPGISAFIGADITAGMLACGLHVSSGRTEMLVDIGTNGEIVLAFGGRILATATAAGPAFEGATISCGLPAVDGAIDHVFWRDGWFSFSTLGALPPAGVCGSGLLDLLACLRRAGRMDGSGGLHAETDPEGVRFFALSSDPPVRITQADIRQLQLAKGAIAAGIRVLCRGAGVELSDIERLHLAGGFGSSLSSESAAAIGLIPDELAGRIRVAGNTALAGTLLTARNPELLESVAQSASEVHVLDLSREAAFQDAFVNAMRFPPLPADT